MIQQVCDCKFILIKSQIIPVLNKIFISVCPPSKQIFKQVYKFCNILIPGRAEQKTCESGRKFRPG